MKQIFILLSFLLWSQLLTAQNTFRAIIRNDRTREVLKGATAFIPYLKRSAVSDSSGLLMINNIPNGKFEIEITFVGFGRVEKVFNFPMQHAEQILGFALEPHSDELAEVVIQSTRTNQNLKDIPTRVEALPLEELDEKSTMRPGDIKMLLGETTGIHVRQTSAVSGTASFRIQGLDSRYTQLLQDGMPMYQGYSGGLSLLQISPLDLKQVEFIKGSASTLYGGGAIAGLVNLISKTPGKTPETTILLNGTSAKGGDASAFYSRKWKHIGTTVFGAYNYNGAYDPSGIGFTALPQTKRFTFNPKLFLYLDDKNSGSIGLNTTYENRYGGDLEVINGKTDQLHQYFERNKTLRFSTQVSFTHKINEESKINFKNTVGYFDRQVDLPGANFKGKQLSSFSEINYGNNGERTNWVGGINLLTDHFSVPPAQNNLNYSQTTVGAFLQNTFKAADWFSLESGIRIDASHPGAADRKNGAFILPRLNGLFKFSEEVVSRIGGGLGYKMPTPFVDETEQEGYQNLKPVVINQLKAEQSYGLNGDISYRSAVGDAFISINQLFFYTKVDHPLIVQNNLLINGEGYITTQGAETNVKLSMDELGFYLGYTYTDARQHFNGHTVAQNLSPKNQVSLDVTYELEDSFRFGAESFYTGSQLLNDGTKGRQFITFGLLLQKMWKHFDLYINAENLSDRRQARWGSMYNGTLTNPHFKDVYAPVEGSVINAGIRIKL